MARRNVMVARLRVHFAEYLIEAASLGIFMLVVGLVRTALEYAMSLVRQTLSSPSLRHLFLGFALATTKVAISRSGWGKRSGCHLNPAVTLTFARLGKVALPDEIGYVTAQFVGGLIGLSVVGAILQ